MPETPIIDEPSVASLLVEVYSGSEALATCSGFVVVRNGVPYLVTNWHCLTGRRIDNHQWNGKPQLPTRIRVWQNKLNALGNWIAVEEDLLDNDYQALWFEHPKPDQKIDVAVLPLTNLDGVGLHPYALEPNGPQPKNRVAETTYIIGFPFGLTGAGRLAIWVQGSVATEPLTDFDNRPCFLVDSRTRTGQSGSPVIIFARDDGAIALDDNVARFATGGGPFIRLLGVYSGRVNAESDLGYVWRTETIVETIDAAVRGRTNFA